MNNTYTYKSYFEAKTLQSIIKLLLAFFCGVGVMFPKVSDGNFKPSDCNQKLSRKENRFWKLK